ncbi:LOW QUALITY PROTEIN: hypothetical protein V2J09_008870 [Rumex salicifolius]
MPIGGCVSIVDNLFLVSVCSLGILWFFGKLRNRTKHSNYPQTSNTGACPATSELICLENLLRDFKNTMPLPICLHCDNLAALHIAHNPLFHERTKHLLFDSLYIWDKTLYSNYSCQIDVANGRYFHKAVRQGPTSIPRLQAWSVVYTVTTWRLST